MLDIFLFFFCVLVSSYLFTDNVVREVVCNISFKNARSEGKQALFFSFFICYSLDDLVPDVEVKLLHMFIFFP